MGKLGPHIVVQGLLALIVAGFAGFTALIMAGALGGVAMGVAPEPTFGLVEGIVCPPGYQLEYYSVRRSYHRPGESEPHVECVSEPGSGEGRDVLLQAVLAVLGLSFAAVFLSVFVLIHAPLSVIALLLTARFTRDSGGTPDPSDSPPATRIA